MNKTKREIMCQYGNCTNEVKDGSHAVRITTNSNYSHTKVESPCFCSYEHASLWLTDKLAEAAKRKSARR